MPIFSPDNQPHDSILKEITNKVGHTNYTVIEILHDATGSDVKIRDFNNTRTQEEVGKLTGDYWTEENKEYWRHSAEVRGVRLGAKRGIRY